MGRINWMGLWTLFVREVRRFLKVYIQTVMAPVITTLIFMAIFALALGRAVEVVAGVPFMEFLAPGLIMMAMLQNAFANTSSSLMTAKVQGNIVDVLMPPLTPGELMAGFTLGGVCRGLLVALVVGLAMAAFVTIHVHNVFFIVYHALAASLMLSLIGMIAGIWADKFDHMAAVTNFVITPLSFLSGTFYTVDRLPESIQFVAYGNPFFHAIDGFRYGFLGHADGRPLTGVVVVGVVNLVLLVVTYGLLKRGYKLKA